MGYAPNPDQIAPNVLLCALDGVPEARAHATLWGSRHPEQKAKGKSRRAAILFFERAVLVFLGSWHEAKTIHPSYTRVPFVTGERDSDQKYSDENLSCFSQQA